jgi:hypothetical protein
MQKMYKPNYQERYDAFKENTIKLLKDSGLEITYEHDHTYTDGNGDLVEVFKWYISCDGIPIIPVLEFFETVFSENLKKT